MILESIQTDFTVHDLHDQQRLHGHSRVISVQLWFVHIVDLAVGSSFRCSQIWLSHSITNKIVQRWRTHVIIVYLSSALSSEVTIAFAIGNSLIRLCWNSMTEFNLRVHSHVISDYLCCAHLYYILECFPGHYSQLQLFSTSETNSGNRGHSYEINAHLSCAHQYHHSELFLRQYRQISLFTTSTTNNGPPGHLHVISSDLICDIKQ